MLETDHKIRADLIAAYTIMAHSTTPFMLNPMPPRDVLERSRPAGRSSEEAGH
jgi:hypothetical protein